MRSTVPKVVAHLATAWPPTAVRRKVVNPLTTSRTSAHRRVVVVIVELTFLQVFGRRSPPLELLPLVLVLLLLLLKAKVLLSLKGCQVLISLKATFKRILVRSGGLKRILSLEGKVCLLKSLLALLNLETSVLLKIYLSDLLLLLVSGALLSNRKGLVVTMLGHLDTLWKFLSLLTR